MSQIRFFGLGGLGENGKNMYVCEVDERIFILDAGLKYPSVELYGIDTVMPDITYLLQNVHKIQGIFISHGHEDHVGAIIEVLKKFNIGVFGTHFTISIIENMLLEENLKLENYRLYRINEDKVLKFGNINVEFYNVSHGIPETVNVVIKTEDGAIIYAPDFCFDPNIDKRYRISFNKISEVAKGGVLALCTESLGTSNLNRASNNVLFNHEILDAVQSDSRVIFSIFSTDLDRIQRVINISIENNRKIAIIGRKAQRIVDIAINNGYLKIPEDKLVNLKYMTDEIKNNDKDLVVIVAGVRHEPFYMLQRMCKGVDKLIEINSNDRVVLVSQTIPGTERIAARTMDVLLKKGAKATQISKAILRSYHASIEDLKMLYMMLQPKYIIPIVGEYRHQYQQKQVAIDASYSDDRIIMLSNGEVATFDNGKYEGIKEKVQVGDVLVDGSIVGDINEVVLKDRELLSQEGVVIITSVIDCINKTIKGGPEIVTKGFNGLDLETNINNYIDITSETIYSYLYKKNIDWNDAKSKLRDKISKLIYKDTKKNPIVLVSIIDINKQ